MIEIDGKNYVLKYNISRIEMIENSTGKSVMADIRANSGMLSIASLKLYFAYGLKEEGSDVFYPTKKALEIAEQLILRDGYTTICGTVVEALERDCPFFFRVG